MSLHHEAEPLPATREALEAALPRVTPKLCIFVHGLGCTEVGLGAFSRRNSHGDRNTNFGTLLASDLGYTPLYVRYNTGLHVSENGRKLAELVRERRLR